MSAQNRKKPKPVLFQRIKVWQYLLLNPFRSLILYKDLYLLSLESLNRLLTRQIFNLRPLLHIGESGWDIFYYSPFSHLGHGRAAQLWQQSSHTCWIFNKNCTFFSSTETLKCFQTHLLVLCCFLTVSYCKSIACISFLIPLLKGMTLIVIVKAWC